MTVLQRIKNEVSRAFKDQQGVPSAEFPPINVWRGPDGFVVTAEAPGLKLGDFDLTVHQNTLTIKGRREPEAKEPEASFHRRERTFGPFARTISFPFNIDGGQMKTSAQNGILTVEVPRLVETKPKPAEQDIVKDDADDILSRPSQKGRTTVFISYRRIDSADITGRIYDRLIQHFGADGVFKDVDSIPLGVDFRKYIVDYVGRCDVLLAIIGKHWLAQNSGSDGLSLGNTRDFVSLEIESALERHVPIIPVIVQGATMPSEEELPDRLRSFAYYNAIPIRPDPDFNQDCARLIKGIEFHICSKAKKYN